jgi:protease II
VLEERLRAAEQTSLSDDQQQVQGSAATEHAAAAAAAAAAFPHLLIRAALHDSEVPIWDSLKVVARFRRLSSLPRPSGRHQVEGQVLLRVVPGGHTAYKQTLLHGLKESAFKLAFLLQTVCPCQP